jgi:hypothetical protein
MAFAIHTPAKLETQKLEARLSQLLVEFSLEVAKPVLLITLPLVRYFQQ